MLKIKQTVPTVLLVAPSLSVKGGISSFIKNLLNTSLSDKYNFIIVSSHVDGPKIFKFIVALYGLLKVKYLLHNTKVDLAYIHGSDVISCLRKYFFFKIIKSKNIPIIYHFHGGNFIKRFLKSPIFIKQKIKMLFENSEKVLCISKKWKTDLISVIPGSKITVLPNGVQIPCTFKSKNFLNKNKRKCIISFMGLIAHSKGVFDLVNVVKRLTKCGFEIELRIGGHGDIKTLNKLKGKNKNILYLGWLNDKEKEILYQKTDIFVLPSYYEGMPMCILEAMSYGIPVIATSVGGIPEVVEDKKTGILVPPGDIKKLTEALKYLVENRDIRQKFGEAARRRVEEMFNIETVAMRLDVLFSEVINKSNN